ncbi:RNA polymerase sigma-70 factor [Flavitalea sp. BT771]|uniref:RNA polymerase sigma-70 factor n=1 Tax=Flavitalea sp. BT771 TaxID=3063329 RepID=UPI0026E12FC4|nr:RNA polymerase sigma-70 factor [Flavitalea sp. BT771]MDO6429611.1 RNA polymerase sigma-70 factor [Flavitalea sp. BT771]MDV6218261.1 RNA polymerase sigma-70 factor [Flavitalea sp. BT771]
MPVYDCVQDQELVRLVKESDEHAFKALYDRYFGLLHIHSFQRLKDKDEAKDLVQDIFLRLWEQRQTVPLCSNFSGYLYTCAKNRVLNLLAHKAVQQKYILSIEETANSEAITDHRVRELQLAVIIEKQITLLPPKMRRVFEMSRGSNMTYAEIAQRLNLSKQSVRSHVKGALRQLKAKIGA